MTATGAGAWLHTTTALVAVVLGVGCVEPEPAPPPASPWRSVLGEVHVSELGARFLDDRAVFAVEGRFDDTEGDRRLLTLDFDDQPLVAPWVFDDLTLDASRFVPIVAPLQTSVVARRDNRFVEYQPQVMPTDVATGNSARFAVGPVAGGHVMLAQNTLDNLIAVSQPHGQARASIDLGTAANVSVVAVAPAGDGVLLVAEGAELRGYATTATPFDVGPIVALSTLPDRITGIVTTPRGPDALVGVISGPFVVIGTISAAPLSWQPIATIDTGARAESIDLTMLATAETADIVIQTDALTVVPLLIHHQVELATNVVGPGTVLTDGVQRFGRQVLARAPSGTMLYALRTDPGAVGLYRAPLVDLLAMGIAVRAESLAESLAGPRVPSRAR